MRYEEAGIISGFESSVFRSEGFYIALYVEANSDIEVFAVESDIFNSIVLSVFSKLLIITDHVL